jgi:hypothetical protein
VHRQDQLVRVDKVAPHEDILGIPTINGITSESGPVTEVLHAMVAVPAFAIYTAHPGDANPPS